MGKLMDIGWGIAKGTLGGTAQALLGSGRTAYELGRAVVNRDVDAAADIAKRKAEGIISGAKLLAVESACLGRDVCTNYLADRELVDEHSKERIIRLGATVGSVMLTGHIVQGVMFDDDCGSGMVAEDGTDCNAGDYGYGYVHGYVPAVDVDSLPGVENGRLVDSSALDSIIGMGEVPESHHLDSSQYVRDLSVRSAFLQQHGLEAVPSGYEVHHIIPLCQGGADTPDNMILLPAEDHARVTAAHSAYYGWFTNC